MKTIGIGIIGWGFMGRTHTLAIRSLPLFYPDAVDRESFHASFDGLHSTFPMTGDYSLSLGGYNETRYVGTRNQTVETAQFQLENDGKQYRLTVVYQSDRDGEGFTNFEMVLLLNPAG